MAYWKESVLVLKQRMVDFIRISDSSNSTPNFAVDLLNRGQMRISGERNWDFLKKTVPMAAMLRSGTPKTYDLPADIQYIDECFSITAIDTKPSIWYYKDDPDPRCRYVLTVAYDQDAVSPANPTTMSMEFAYSPLGTLYLKYCWGLTDFSGTVTISDSDLAKLYTFFPPTLLLRAAQLEHLEDKMPSVDEVQLMRQSYERELNKFIERTQNMNVKWDMTIKNNRGVPIKLKQHNMGGQSVGGMSNITPYPNDTMFVGY